MTAENGFAEDGELRGLFTCDLVCWGSASPLMFSEYLRWLSGSLGSAVMGFSHRAKDSSWDGTRPVAFLEDGRHVYGYEVNLWQRIWPGKLCRSSCYGCGFHSTERPGDLTMGDYWGLADAHPGLAAEGGVSCLMANTRRGAALVAACDGALRLVPSELELCANRSQPMLLHAPDPDTDKPSFWNAYYANGFSNAAETVGALKPPTLKGTLKKAGKGAVAKLIDVFRPSLFRRGEASGCESGELESSDGWKEFGMNESMDSPDQSYPRVFAAKNRSDEVRQRSASGGVFNALASAVINRGGVVYGCAFDENLAATHVRCETMADVERCMGSKYSQSRMGNAINEVCSDLEDGRLVLFTGTPCQVAAVRNVCGATKASGGGH